MRLVLDRDAEVMLAIREALMEEPCERELAERHGITVGRFLWAHVAADVVGLEMDGRLAGGMFFMDGQVHLGILRHARARWCRYLRVMLERGFARHGSELVARVYAKNLRARKFVEGVGGIKRRTTELFVEYEVIKGKMIWDRVFPS